jgi:hypothetical protein
MAIRIGSGQGSEPASAQHNGEAIAHLSKGLECQALPTH